MNRKQKDERREIMFQMLLNPSEDIALRKLAVAYQPNEKFFTKAIRKILLDLAETL